MGRGLFRGGNVNVASDDPWPEHKEITRQAFDCHARAKEFIEGPWKDTFGDGYGEPYNPKRYLHGTLNSGQKVKAKYGNW